MDTATLVMVGVFVGLTAFVIGWTLAQNLDQTVDRLRRERNVAQAKAADAERRALVAEQRAADAERAMQNGADLLERLEAMQAEIVRLRNELQKASAQIAELQRSVTHA